MFLQRKKKKELKNEFEEFNHLTSEVCDYFFDTALKALL